MFETSSTTKLDFAARYAEFERAVGQWLKGDRSVSQEELAETAVSLMADDYFGVADRYRSWVFDLRRRWARDFEYSFRPTAPDRAALYRRLALLLAADLSPYVSDPAASKRRWALRYAEPADSPTAATPGSTPDPSPGFDLRTLLAYQQFLAAAAPWLPAPQRARLAAEYGYAATP